MQNKWVVEAVIQDLAGNIQKKNIEKRLNQIIKASDPTGVRQYKISISDWENYGKKRTYIKVHETKKHSKHHVVYDYGYVDRQTNKYVPGKSNMEKNYTLGGRSVF